MTSNAVIHPSNPVSSDEIRLLLRHVPTEWPLRPECHGDSITRFIVGRPPNPGTGVHHSHESPYISQFEACCDVPKGFEGTRVAVNLRNYPSKSFRGTSSVFVYMPSVPALTLPSGSDFIRGLPVVSTVHSWICTVGTSHGTNRLSEALRHVQSGFMQGAYH